MTVPQSNGLNVEAMIVSSLMRAGYVARPHVCIGERLGGGKHIVDVIAEDCQRRRALVSIKWQEVTGTAEDKTPFEVICLAQAIIDSEPSDRETYHTAFLVLGGEGMKRREWYLTPAFRRHLRYGHLVNVLTLEQFIARVNRRQLFED